MDTSDRIVGIVEGDHPGPLVVAVGAIHGNEPAGVMAIRGFLDLINSWRGSYGLRFDGNFIGLVGHLEAYRSNRRYFNFDLNRCWSVDRITTLLNQSDEGGILAQFEEAEMLSVIRVLREVIETYQPREVIILDLHTTSAQGGVFSIPMDTGMELAASIPAPILLGLSSGFSGTFLQGVSFLLSTYGSSLTTVRCLAFETGQHQEAEAVQRGIWALLSILGVSGCIDLGDVKQWFGGGKELFREGLPKAMRIFYRHEIVAGSNFSMVPGYVNFQFVQKGEVLAIEASGSVIAPASGYLLMPLYQSQGSDGFFLAKAVEVDFDSLSEG